MNDLYVSCIFIKQIKKNFLIPFEFIALQSPLCEGRVLMGNSETLNAELWPYGNVQMVSRSLTSQPHENMLLGSPVAGSTSDWWTQLLPLRIFYPLTRVMLSWAAPSQWLSMQTYQGRPVLAKCEMPPLVNLDLRSPHRSGQTFTWIVLESKFFQLKSSFSFPLSFHGESHMHQNLKTLPVLSYSQPQ